MFSFHNMREITTWPGFVKPKGNSYKAPGMVWCLTEKCPIHSQNKACELLSREITTFSPPPPPTPTAAFLFLAPSSHPDVSVDGTCLSPCSLPPFSSCWEHSKFKNIMSLFFFFKSCKKTPTKPKMGRGLEKR